MLRKTDLKNALLLLLVGILTYFSLVILDHFIDGIVWNTLLLLYIPGLTFGIVIGLKIVDFKSQKKWKLFGLIIILSILANFTSTVLYINLTWASWWTEQTIWKTILMNEYLLGAWSGLLGSTIISLIPNIILRTIKLTVLHFITCLVGSVIGQFIFFQEDIHYIGLSIGFGIWFAILGILTIKNIQLMRLFTKPNNSWGLI